MRKSTKAIVVATVLAAGGLIATPAQAAAYTPEAVCGAGYAKVSGGTKSVGGWGTVYLLYNRKNGYNCVVTIKSSYVKTATRTSATLEVSRPASGGTIPYVNKDSDSGKYRYYAGPVKLPGKGMCVRFSGTIADTRVNGEVKTGGRKSWGNCG